MTENRSHCKHTDCVEVCPGDAIFAEADVPAGQEPFLALNAKLAKEWPVIAVKIPALSRFSHGRTISSMWTGIRCGTKFTAEVGDPNVDDFGAHIMCSTCGRRKLHAKPEDPNGWTFAIRIEHEPDPR